MNVPKNKRKIFRLRNLIFLMLIAAILSVIAIISLFFYVVEKTTNMEEKGMLYSIGTVAPLLCLVEPFQKEFGEVYNQEKIDDEYEEGEHTYYLNNDYIEYEKCYGKFERVRKCIYRNHKKSNTRVTQEEIDKGLREQYKIFKVFNKFLKEAIVRSKNIKTHNKESAEIKKYLIKSLSNFEKMSRQRRYLLDSIEEWESDSRERLQISILFEDYISQLEKDIPAISIFTSNVLTRLIFLQYYISNKDVQKAIKDAAEEANPGSSTCFKKEEILKKINR